MSDADAALAAADAAARAHFPRCDCGRSEIVAIRPGHQACVQLRVFEAEREYDATEPASEPSRAWCAACWQRQFGRIAREAWK